MTLVHSVPCHLVFTPSNSFWLNHFHNFNENHAALQSDGNCILMSREFKCVLRTFLIKCKLSWYFRLHMICMAFSNPNTGTSKPMSTVDKQENVYISSNTAEIADDYLSTTQASQQ